MKPQGQLDLGGERVYDSADFDEHVVNVPMGLILDPEVPGEAHAVYGVMKSFGKRANASLDAYAERLGWGLERVQTWQKALVSAKWMTLLQEGKPPAVGEDTGTPRLWWMNKDKGEAPPLSAVLAHPRVGVLPALVKSQPRQNTPPKQGLSSKLQGTSTKKTTPAKAGPFVATDGTSWADLLTDYDTAFKLAKEDPTASPEFSIVDFAHLKRLAKNPRFTRTLYQSRLANMKHHAFHVQLEFSLTYFCTKFREFDDQSERIVQGKRGPRGRYLPVVGTEDFEG